MGGDCAQRRQSSDAQLCHLGEQRTGDGSRPDGPGRFAGDPEFAAGRRAGRSGTDRQRNAERDPRELRRVQQERVQRLPGKRGRFPAQADARPLCRSGAGCLLLPASCDPGRHCQYGNGLQGGLDGIKDAARSGRTRGSHLDRLPKHLRPAALGRGRWTGEHPCEGPPGSWDRFWGGTDKGGEKRVIPFAGRRPHEAFTHGIRGEDFEFAPNSAVYNRRRETGIDPLVVGPGNGYSRFRDSFQYREWQQGDAGSLAVSP